MGLACIKANCNSDRQQKPFRVRASKPVGIPSGIAQANLEGVMPVASQEAMESPSFKEGEDVKGLIPSNIGHVRIDLIFQQFIIRVLMIQRD